MPAETHAAVVFAVGQPVHWPAAPRQLAQVAELRRSRVRLFYQCSTGRKRHPIVSAIDLALLQRTDPPLPLPTLFGRGIARPRRTECR